MRLGAPLLLALLACCGLCAALTRPRRSLSFPKGSNFVLTVTLLKPIQVRVPSNWNLDLEFDVVWPMLGAAAGAHPRRHQRRQRRQLYASLELALDSQGLPGRQCLLRAICEARFLLDSPPGLSLVEDLLRLLFAYPSGWQRGRAVEDVYDNACVTRTDCDIAYPCPLSLLDMLLNYRNDP